MTTFLHVAVANLAVAALLAVLATLAGRFCRRPALVHSLWLLVLLKLVTPPLLPLEVPWLEAPAAEPAGDGVPHSEPVARPETPPETVAAGAPVPAPAPQTY